MYCNIFHVFRCVWWVRHRNWCPLLVQTQCLPPLRHGHLHGSAGAPQHGDRVSVSVWRASAPGEGRQVKGETLNLWISSGGAAIFTLLLLREQVRNGSVMTVYVSVWNSCVFCGSPGCCTEMNGFLFSVSLCPLCTVAAAWVAQRATSPFL